MGICSKQNLFIAMTVIWVASLVFDVHRQPRLGHNWYVYKLVMLTNLNFVLDVFYSVLVAAASKSRVLRKIADFMYYTSVFPVGVVTCGLFWGLYYIDPALVMPEWIAKLIPAWLNHITHTYPIIYILLDSYFHKRNAPGTITCWIVSATLVFIYFMIIGYVRFYDGFWLYPILQLFSIQHFVLSYFLAFFGFFLLTKAAYFLNKMMHRTRYPTTTGGARKMNKKRH